MAKTINISLPEDLVAAIDKAAKDEYASRSDFIRETLVRRLKGERIVKDDQWAVVADFREVDPKGVPADELIDAINAILS